MPSLIPFSVVLGKIDISPIVENLTLFLCSSFISFLIVDNNSVIKAFTSLFGLFQFSVEKVNKVKYLTPISPHIRVISRTEFIPSRCPAILGRPLSLAHLPLPSIIIAICFGTFFK